MCDITIPDPRLSRVHGDFVVENGRCIYRDRKSTNGSYVNGLPVETQILNVGDRIVLGMTILEVVVESSLETVNFEDTSASINLTVPVQRVLGGGIESDLSSLSVADVQFINKRLQNLETLYQVAHDLTQTMVLEDLYVHLRARLFAIYPNLWRISVLRREDEVLQLQFSRTRNAESDAGVPISRSIIEQAERQQVGLLASDFSEIQPAKTSIRTVRPSTRSVMCAPLIHRDRVIGALYLDTLPEAEAFDREDLALLTALSSQLAISMQNAVLYENVQNAYHQSVLALVNMMETRDPYTTGHTERTCRYALGIGQALGLTHERLSRLKMAAQLHDIGKIGIQPNVLDKPDSLSETESRTMREHVRAAERILRPIENLHDVIPIILGHHEHYDGSGYPDGLREEAILLESRILAVADAFDAMTTQRPYNKPLTFGEALARCQESAGRQFDPAVVQALSSYLRQHRAETAARRAPHAARVVY